MKLLVVTQKVDLDDPILGFFHRWIIELSARVDKLNVICLEEGRHELPQKVGVYSLGKETSRSKIKYILKFYKYIWDLRHDYDAVLVHMNEEYMLLAGDMWRLMGKRVYLWRNHAKGTRLTNVAGILAHKVFYTSPQSYTARFKNAVQMPVGIDTDFFKPDQSVVKAPNSILFLGRISPVKRVVEFLEWFDTLDQKFSATVVGVIPEEDREYGEVVRKRADKRVRFVGGVDQNGALKLYQVHETYANFTPAGSYDKTIFEAAACGLKLRLENEDLKFLESKNSSELRDYIEKEHSLKLCIDRVLAQML